jgi:hypothetical protein
LADGALQRPLSGSSPPTGILRLAECENELVTFPSGRYYDQVDAWLLFLEWFAQTKPYRRPIFLYEPISASSLNARGK